MLGALILKLDDSKTFKRLQVVITWSQHVIAWVTKSAIAWWLPAPFPSPLSTLQEHAPLSVDIWVVPTSGALALLLHGMLFHQSCCFCPLRWCLRHLNEVFFATLSHQTTLPTYMSPLLKMCSCGSLSLPQGYKRGPSVNSCLGQGPKYKQYVHNSEN